MSIIMSTRNAARTVILFATISAIQHSGQAFQLNTDPIIIGRSSPRLARNSCPTSARRPITPMSSPSLSSPVDAIVRIGDKTTTATPLFLSAESKNAAETSDEPAASSVAESILDEFHQSDLPFRIVVIGNGAILETTSRLGPVSKSSISPKSGERLITFASEDKSFEFHVKVKQVCKIAFVSSAERRVARFLSENGTPICSLILADRASEAEKWFDGMIEKHGNEIIM